jgi:uncharacterized coiled-coil protein SlyX
MTQSPYSTEARLDRIEDLLREFLNEFRDFRAKAQIQEKALMAEIDLLVAQVAETRGVTDAAVVAIQGLRDQIDLLVQNATDLEALKAQLTDLTGQLDASERDLAAAIATDPTP